MGGIPRIGKVTAVRNSVLLVEFDNGTRRRYDCSPLFARPDFALLKTPAFFRAVRVDPGGYGVSWNDALDLSEYELWTNGEPVDDQAAKVGE